MARGVLIVIGTSAMLCVAAPTAFADVGIGDSTHTPDKDGPSGGSDGQDIYASAIRYDESKNGTGSNAGPVTPVGNWTPPPCWFEPRWTPTEFEKVFTRRWDVPHFSGAGEAYAADKDTYINGKPYKDFNKSREGEGMWWDVVRNKNFGDDPAIFACDRPTFWVDRGGQPDVENAVTPDILAQLAYERIRVPDTDVSLSPEQRQTVNLPTWAWLDEAEFKPVSVTASLPEIGISATTTATPVALSIEPGTSDAELYPSSGECPINEDGSIGEPFRKSAAEADPPCGLTYLRATQDNESYEMRATITWEVEWTGTGGTGGDLPDGTFGTTQDITVQEVQAINR